MKYKPYFKYFIQEFFIYNDPSWFIGQSNPIAIFGHFCSKRLSLSIGEQLGNQNINQKIKGVSLW